MEVYIVKVFGENKDQLMDKVADSPEIAKKCFDVDPDEIGLEKNNSGIWWGQHDRYTYIIKEREVLTEDDF